MNPLGFTFYFYVFFLRKKTYSNGLKCLRGVWCCVVCSIFIFSVFIKVYGVIIKKGNCIISLPLSLSFFFILFPFSLSLLSLSSLFLLFPFSLSPFSLSPPSLFLFFSSLSLHLPLFTCFPLSFSLPLSLSLSFSLYIPSLLSLWFHRWLKYF